VPDFKTATLFSHLDFKSTLVSVLVLLLSGLLSRSLILQSPKGLMHEITRVTLYLSANTRVTFNTRVRADLYISSHCQTFKRYKTNRHTNAQGIK